MSTQKSAPASEGTNQVDPVVAGMAIALPLKVGEWLPGYYGEIAVQHKNGTWSISHSNTVDPQCEWKRGDKAVSGPDMSREMGYVAWIPLAVPTSTLPVTAPTNQDAALAAIEFALQTDDGLTFLRLWNEGDFDALRREWPEAPDAIYIGADPMHPGSQPANATPAGGFIPVGTLSVFADKDASFGHAYDISATPAGHRLLQGLDGAALFAVKPAVE